MTWVVCQAWDSRQEYHLCSNKGEWGDRLLYESRGSVVGALAFQSPMLSSIAGAEAGFSYSLLSTFGLSKLTIYLYE